MKKESKKTRILKAYFIITQVIFSMLVPALIGLFIAYKYYNKPLYIGLFTSIGLVLGLFLAFITLYRYYKRETLEEKKDEENKK